MIVHSEKSSKRSGLEPGFWLLYGSVDGNDSFGLGWYQFPFSITRKPDKSPPMYQSAEESYECILSSIEDLLPCLKQEVLCGWVDEIVPFFNVISTGYDK